MADKSEISSRLDALRRVDGVKAVAPGVDSGVGVRQAAASVANERGLSVSDATAFEQAGWTFVGPSESGAAASGSDVVADADGRMKLLGRALNVKIGDAVPKAEAQAILRDNGLSIRRELGFSPNLFVVESPDENALSKAKSLNELDTVEFAEPVLIEPLSGR